MLNIYWKDWCLSWNSNTLVTWCKELTHWKNPDAGKDWRREEKGTTEDEMVRWHHWLDEHEFEEAPGVGDGQGSPACCSPWSRKESDTTEQPNWMQGKNKRISIRQVRIEIFIYVCIYSQNKEQWIVLKCIKERCMKKMRVVLGPNGQHLETQIWGGKHRKPLK